jgi:LysR family transcriptional regulator, nitrogen assimilation regulatory protein
VDLRQIRYFVAVYEEGSFSRAAARENCTQPGLSVQMAQLEAELGQRLFDRNPRGVAPTIAGKHFYEACTDILRSVRGARQRMLDLADAVVGRINIGVPPSFSKSALPAALRRFAEEHPYVEVRIAEAYSGTLSEWVVAGDLELAIVTQPPPDLGLATAPFFRDRLVLVRSAAAGARGRAATGGERGLRLAVPSGRHSLRQKIESHPRLSAPHVSRVLEIDGLAATLELVHASDWATVLPMVAVAGDIREGRLRAEAVGAPELWLEYFLVQTKDVPISVASRRFLDLLDAELRTVAGAGRIRSGTSRRAAAPPKKEPQSRSKASAR